MKSSLAALFALCFSLLATATPFRHRAFEHAPLVTTNEIEKWVTPNEAGEIKVTSVEALLDRLPAIYRSYSVFQFASGGQHRVSEKFPRLIFFGPDARLLMAISTDPSDPKAQVAEFMEFDPETATFAATEINFARPVEKRLERNPVSCRTCHRAQVRPNWEPYDVWPGTFGGVHDTVPGNTRQATWYADLLNRAKTDARLKYTKLADRDDTKADPADTRYIVTQGIGANAGLSVTLNFANRERITRQLITSKHHAEYRAAIAAAIVDCPGEIDQYLPASLPTKHPRAYAEVEKETREWIRREYAQRVQSMTTLLGYLSTERVEKDADRFGLRPSEIRRTARLRYLMENRIDGSLRVQDWSTAFDATAYSFNDGVSGLENLTGHYLPRAFADKPGLLKLSPYKGLEFAVTSYNDKTHGKDADIFKLELFELTADKVAPFCAELRRGI